MGGLSGAVVTLLENNRVDVKPAAAASVGWWSQSTKRDSVLTFLFGVVVFTCCPAPEFINFDARFGLFAQEMLRDGPSFFPTTYGTPYPDYPAASTFLVYLVSLPLGRVTPFTAVLPTAESGTEISSFSLGIGHDEDSGSLHHEEFSDRLHHRFHRTGYDADIVWQGVL